MAFGNIDGSDVLVVCCNAGVQFWDESGTNMLYYYAINNLVGPEDEEYHYFKGIGACSAYIAVGTSFGSILVFTTMDTGAKGEISFSVAENLVSAASSVHCVSASPSLLCCGNDNGDIFVYNMLQGNSLIFQHSGKGQPCTSICHQNDIVYAAYHSGHIRIFRPHIYEMSVEISAHIRSISALIINPTLNILVSCAEDQYVHVWSIPDFGSGSSGHHMDILFSDKLTNRMCTGACFLRDEKICVIAYDDENAVIFKKDD